ncbi:MAG: M48 family metallopeptidase [Proteobacteria bacterium]|nr:M48 family metallopeptidase [Pseudomonadota bacterium]MBU1709675.1 M48 family metallopeptidase [Pseudomonadota bacterium]
MKQPSSQSIIIPGVGPVLLERSNRAKRLCITVMPLYGIRVAVPKGISFSLAQQLILNKIPWMSQSLARLRQTKIEHGDLPVRNNALSRAQARDKLLSRLDALAREHGYHYKKVFVKNQKTLWGSCSSKNNINLNLKLLSLPEELMDFILIHELVHTRIKNHGPLFWAALEGIVPDAVSLRKRLKRYRLHFLE